MPKPRHTQIAVESTPYYHCVSRCVRRAFLCGRDKGTGQDYEHRREWIEDEILRLASVFALDVSAYAVMSNHFHVVLFINADKSKGWTDSEVIVRGHQLFKGTLQSQRFVAGEDQNKSAMQLLGKQVAEWRSRLTDISWFMRVLNEKIARMANREDGCSGRFWEGRFKCQALLDEQALMACMAYVDLNPVRTNIASTPEASEHTSVKRRVDAAKSEGRVEGVRGKQPVSLQRFAGNPRLDMPEGLPFRLTDYLELVDWTGRQIREDKRGSVDADLPCILKRLEIDEDHWLYMTQNFESTFKTFVGAYHTLLAVYTKLDYQRIPGRAACESLFQR